MILLGITSKTPGLAGGLFPVLARLCLSLRGMSLRPKTGILVLSLYLLLLSNPLSAKFTDFPEFELENGLRVVVVPNNLTPLVHHVLFYKAGSADEVTGRSGAAHYLEHLMFKGTEKFPGRTAADLVIENGGYNNAATSWDFTAYYQTVDKSNLEMLMEIEADRMTNLKLTPEVMKPELGVVLEERRQTVDNNPWSIIGEEARESLFTNHPYGRPIIGWGHEIMELNMDDVFDFYHKWYAPNNAVLVVGGDVDAEQVLALAEKHYGKVPAREVPERKRTFVPVQRAKKRLEYSDPRVGVPTYRLEYIAPGGREDKRWFGDLGYDRLKVISALALFADAFGGESNSRLHKRLIVEDEIASSVGAFFSDGGLDYNAFGFFVSPTRGEPLEPAVEALRKEIDTFLESGMTAEELDVSRKRIMRDEIMMRDTLRLLPGILGELLVAGYELDDLDDLFKNINDVTVEEVNAIISALIKPERAVEWTMKSRVQDGESQGEEVPESNNEKEEDQVETNQGNVK